MRVTLFDAEREQVDRLAAERNRFKQQAGIPTRRYAAWRDDETTHRLGLQAEAVIARLLGVRLNTAHTLAGDGGYDLAWNGMRLDVKMRGRRFDDLVCLPDLSDFQADAVILCWPGLNSGEIEVVGVISRERFRQEARRDILCAPPRLVLPWWNLTLLSSFTVLPGQTC